MVHSLRQLKNCSSHLSASQYTCRPRNSLSHILGWLSKFSNSTWLVDKGHVLLLSLITWLLFSVCKPLFLADVAGFLFSPMSSSASVYITILGLPVHVNSTMNVVMPCKLVEALVVELLVVSSYISSTLSAKPPSSNCLAFFPLLWDTSAFHYSYDSAFMLWWFASILHVADS